MKFKQRSQKPELMDNVDFSDPILAKNLAEIAATNRWLGARRTLLDALNHIYKKYRQNFTERKITITELGCGDGNLLLAINHWANKKNLNVELTGIDINPFMLNCAQQQVKLENPINYKVADLTDSQFIAAINADIYTLNSFCHHLDDNELAQLLKTLLPRSNLAIIINDLHRHWLAYYGIKFIAKLFNFSYLTQHDGPLSVLRAFRKQELVQILETAGIKSFTIRHCWAFRWQVIIWR